MTRGCPQGSACGPGFWNILYDDALKLQLPDNSELVAFADDLILMSWSKNINELQTNVNQAIETIAQWGENVKLTFNEKKTQAMICTKARQIPNVTFTMKGSQLPLVENITYLGVIINRKLNWKPHLLKLQQKLIITNKKLSMIARNTWGLKFPAAKMIYKGAIEPLALYAVEIWSPALKTQWARKLLTTIQRTALLRVCKSYRSVSAEALQIIADAMPMDIRAQLAADLATAKNSKIVKMGELTIEVQPKTMTRRHPSVPVQTFATLQQKEVIGDGVLVFTDGSKIENAVGGAFVVYEHSVETHKQIFSLSDYCTVFQAELMAIKLAVSYLQHQSQYTQTTIFTDSQSALLAICDRSNSSPTVIDIQDALISALENGVSITINWIKAHVGNEGNERADILAKSGALSRLSPMEMKAPFSHVKRKLTVKAREDWNNRWTSSTKGRWTAKFFPTVEHRRKCKQLEPDFITTQFLTGHGKFGEYLHGKTLRTNPYCECGAVQSVTHLIFDCPLLFNERNDLVAQVETKRMSFVETSLHHIIIESSTYEELIQLFKLIHRNLVRWELVPS